MTQWEILQQLRSRFLAEDSAVDGDYWASLAELEAYDATFARRIGWKWEPVLREAKQRGWRPASRALVDWGCGTGIASRALLADSELAWEKIFLWDRSNLARQFAKDRLLEKQASLTIVTDESAPPSGVEYTLLLSHVLGELDDDAVEKLSPLIERAESVLWVEPGTPALSRRLIAQRERWRDRFSLLAPCPHQAKCGLLSPENTRHWCHFFAEPPREVFHSAEWRDFSERLHIDLRSLPVSFLVMQRTAARPATERLLGRPRLYKGYATALVCDETGVREQKWLKRDDKARFKRLEKGGFDPLRD